MKKLGQMENVHGSAESSGTLNHDWNGQTTPPPQHFSTPTPLFESAKPLVFVGGDKGGKVVVSLPFNESASGGGVQVCYLHLFSAGDTEGSAARALMLFRPLGARR